MLRQIIIVLICLASSSCSSFKPKETGLQGGTLRPCPPAPKCVSSLYKEGLHHIDPLTYQGSKQSAYQRIIEIIASMPKSKIITREPNYIHVQFEVGRFKWIDDTEFLFMDDQKLIHYSSSASAPVGFWDWGKNKRRAVEIKSLFDQGNL